MARSFDAERVGAIALPCLAQVRRYKLMSQAELAARAGLGRNTVIRIEHGADAQYSTVRKLADALGVEPSDLMVTSATLQTNGESLEPPPASAEEISEADAEFERGLLRLMASVRDEHPELFDASGRFRRDVALRMLADRVGGRATLTKAELLALSDQRPPRSPDAP